MKIIIITILIIATLFIPWHAYCQEMELSAEPEPEAVDSVSVNIDEAKLLSDTQALETDTLTINLYENIKILAKQDALDEGNEPLYIIAGILAILPAIIVTFLGGILDVKRRVVSYGLPLIPVQLLVLLGLGNLTSALTDKPDRNITGLSERDKQEYQNTYRKYTAIKRTISMMQGYGLAIGGVISTFLQVASLYLLFMFWAIMCLTL